MKPHRWTLTLLFAAAAWQGSGQTTSVNLTKQGRLATGTTLPAACAPGQLFLKTDAPAGGNLYTCRSADEWTVAGQSSGPAASRPADCVAGQTWLATDTGALTYCSTSGNPGTWSAIAGSASGGVNTLCTVALSATPAFDAARCDTFSLTLGGTAVTASSLVNATPGQSLTFIINQDQSGGRAFPWPSNVTRACSVSTSAGVSTILTAVYDGTTANATYCTTTDTATLVSGPTRGAPSAPASGLSCWFDTAGTWKCKDPGGNVYAAVLTAAGPTANQYVTYIDGNGVAHSAAISASQLSEGTTGSGAVVLAATPTIATPTIASFANAQHSHADAAGGGLLGESALNLGDVTTNDASASRHGFLPKLPGDSSKCLLGDGTYGACGTGGGGGSSVTINGTGTWAPWEGVPFVPYGYYASVPTAGRAGSWECDQWFFPYPTRLANLFTVQPGDGAADDVFIVGVFNNSNNAPGSKIANSEVVIVGNAVGSMGYQTKTWGPGTAVIGTPGFYWGCYSYSSTTGRWSSSPWLTYGTAGNTPGHMVPPRRVKCSNTVTYNGASTTLPATCSSPTSVQSNDNPPYIVITQ
jgi:hypothetical protein